MTTILIVEDHLIIQAFIEKIILSMSTEVNIVKTQYAEKALTFAQNNQVDIFILDIELLDYSGLKLAKQIRELESYLFTPIIFSSGVPTKELEEYRFTHGYKYLMKPFSEKQFVEVIEPLMNPRNNRFEKEIGLTDIRIPTILHIKQKIFNYNINQEDIIYVQYKNRKVFVKTVQEKYQFSAYSLRDIEEMLSNDFIRCHKGYIINRKFIHKVSKINYLIYVKNLDDSIPFGRKYIEHLHQFL